MHVKLDGTAFVCFQSDGEVFQGIIKKLDSNDVYSMIGKKSELPKKNFNECCFEHDPMFYEVELGKSEPENNISNAIKIKDVMRLGGDNCSLLLEEHFEFTTEKLLTDQKADEFIKKYLPARFLGKGCYICIGDVSIDYIYEENEPTDKTA